MPHNFQFPLSERTNCNIVFCNVGTRPSHILSVSSIGTNELQQTHLRLLWAGYSYFQFPLSERTNCNPNELDGTTVNSELSVSSIGTNELQQRSRTKTRRFSFLSVSSIGTNELQPDTMQAEKSSKRRLSVSSIGTNELQLIFTTCPTHPASSFSFLYRNERTATKICDRAAAGMSFFQFPLSERTNCNEGVEFVEFAESLLSVSSIGTNELQLHFTPIERTRPSLFQFPLSERTNCNLRFACDSRLGKPLSVSSIGTNELQQPLKCRTEDSPHNGFQFPLSERTNCNNVNLGSWRTWRIFQFPLSERTNCNYRLLGTFCRHKFFFQFPLSERTNCNRRPPNECFVHLTHLSVSSIGTNELQQANTSNNIRIK